MSMGNACVCVCLPPLKGALFIYAVRVPFMALVSAEISREPATTLDCEVYTSAPLHLSAGLALA